jgi:Na+/phosphate symporter
MLISWVAILVMVIGALVYALAANPKASEMGRIGFFVGLLWTVCLTAGHAVKLL